MHRRNRLWSQNPLVRIYTIPACLPGKRTTFEYSVCSLSFHYQPGTNLAQDLKSFARTDFPEIAVSPARILLTHLTKPDEPDSRKIAGALKKRKDSIGDLNPEMSCAVFVRSLRSYDGTLSIEESSEPGNLGLGHSVDRLSCPNALVLTGTFARAACYIMMTRINLEILIASRAVLGDTLGNTAFLSMTRRESA